MALILDKATTGVTSSSVISGNTTGFTDTEYSEISTWVNGYIETFFIEDVYTQITYTTGLTHLTYIDPFGGINNDPYLIIDSLLVNRMSRNARIGISIYINKSSRDNLKRPIEERSVEINKILFDKYFSMSELESENVFAKAYEYVTSIYTGWKSDE